MTEHQGKLEIHRCLRGMRQIHITGAPRKGVIEEAIATIQLDPGKALRHQYIGVKNYAHFGDQRCDCEYGLGPSHGHIVFSIGRIRSYTAPLDADALYYLEAYRDFPGIKKPVHGGIGPKMVWLGDAIDEWERLTKERTTVEVALTTFVVTSHTEEQA